MPERTRMKVYYEIIPVDWMIGQCICATEKTYFDKHHVVDDGGSGRPFERIAQAMEASGAPESCESYFEATLPIDTIVQNMRTRGFDLIKSEDFSTFVLSHD